MKKILLWLLCITVCFSSVACGKGGNQSSWEEVPSDSSDTVSDSTGENSGSDVPPDTQEELPTGSEKLRAVYPKQYEVVYLTNDEMTELALAYVMGGSAEYCNKGDNFAMKGVDISFYAEGEARSYTLSLALNKEMDGAVEYELETTTLHLDDLLVNTKYYWQVEADYENGAEISGVYTFTTANTPRTIQIDGISNTRDVGGKLTLDGGKIRQNMIFRSARVEYITELGKKQVAEKYGIKTELDLRRDDELFEAQKQGISALGENIKYIHISAPYYMGNEVGIDIEKNQPNLAACIKVFAQADNYPVLFHCTAGRDRTGMISMLLQGFLGVSKRDIYFDYETSIFSHYGGGVSASTVAELVSCLGETYRYVQSFAPQGTYAEACEAFLLHIGVTAEELSSIRSILLEN